MVEREWLLAQHSTVDTFPALGSIQDDPRNSWLERMQHCPQKVLLDRNRIICMTRADQITLSNCSFSNKLTFPIPDHVIVFKQPVTCIKMGFSVTLGISFLGEASLCL